MKETIYTIPINDAFDAECACAVCFIERKLNDENTEHALGASMMEPDFRLISNQKGFCKAHYAALSKAGTALPLSLVLQSHSQLQNMLISDIAVPTKKAHAKNAKKIIDIVLALKNSCAICERTEKQMETYIKNIIYLWKSEKDFKNKFQSKTGFCLPHFSDLLSCALDNMSVAAFAEFYDMITKMQVKSLNEMQNDITEFTKLFDYKNEQQPSENVKTAVVRAIEKYSSI